MAPPRWSFRCCPLLDDDAMKVMGQAITQAVAGGGTACERLERVRADVKLLIRRREETQSLQRGREKGKIQAEIDARRKQVGLGLGPAPNAPPSVQEAAVNAAAIAKLVERKNKILDAEEREWLQDRGFAAHAEDRPTKDFYVRLQESDPERRMPVEEVDPHDGRGPPVRDPKHLCDSARSHFSKRFRQTYDEGSPAVHAARNQCLGPIRVKYRLPPEAAARMNVDSFLGTENVTTAIRELARHKTPGDDGFPADFYAAFADVLAPLLAEAYKECRAQGRLTPTMRRGVISLVYKKKGSRRSWQNYRPLTVSATEYRILAKAAQLRLNEVMQYVVSPSQTANQHDKEIRESTALVQLIAQRCAEQDIDGLLLQLDGEKAFDMVQHRWLAEVLEAMGFPPDFRDLVALLYRDAELVVKVNGHHGDAFTPLNGVKQGCPLSPLLYILSLQPLLASLEEDPHIHGIAIPGDHGVGHEEARVSAYADDLLLMLRGYADLPAAWRYIEPYLAASGGAVNWGKTQVLRCGPLRRPGHAG